MPRPLRRPPSPQLELFPERTPLPPPGAPSWSTLPEPTRRALTGLTRRALTGLVARMLIAHAGAEAVAPEGGDDDL